MDINQFDLAIGAVVLPIAISIVNQRHWPAQLKGLIALLICALYALFILVMRGSLDWGNWRDVLLQTTAAAFIAYNMFWKPSGIAPAIEKATTPVPRTVDGTVVEPPPASR
jgi:hypothetical protein